MRQIYHVQVFEQRGHSFYVNAESVDHARNTVMEEWRNGVDDECSELIDYDISNVSVVTDGVPDLYVRHVIDPPCPECDGDGVVVIGWSQDAYENIEGPCPKCQSPTPPADAGATGERE